MKEERNEKLEKLNKEQAEASLTLFWKQKTFEHTNISQALATPRNPIRTHPLTIPL
jgi:hypothetical protein